MFPFVLNYLPLDLKDSEVLKKEWAWQLRNEHDNMRVERYAINASRSKWVRGSMGDSFDLYYELGDNRNIFTKDNFERMKRIENQLFQIPNYQTKYCQLTSENGKGCVVPISIMRYFDGTYKHLDPVFDDPDFNNISAVLYAAKTNVELHEPLQYFLTKKSVIEPKRVFCEATRTSIPIGWPIRRNMTREAQLKELESFFDSEMKPTYSAAKRAHAGSLKVYYYSLILLAHDGSKIAMQDMMLAIGSLCFIFGYMWFQTESFFVTSLAILSIILSFFSANLFYRIVLDYRYLGHLHIISVFIILGIGADNIFVFFNTWKATGQHMYKSVAHRMSDCYRRTALTMFFTSLTTMVAFIANGTSPLLPIGSFGVFTGVLVAVNYISVVTFFPTVISMYHYYYEDSPCGEGCTHRCGAKVSAFCNTTESGTRMSVFFRDVYFRFITHKIVRWVIVVFFLAVVGFFSYAITLVKVDAKQVGIRYLLRVMN